MVPLGTNGADYELITAAPPALGLLAARFFLPGSQAENENTTQSAADGLEEGGELETRDRKCCHTLQSAVLGICVHSVIAQEFGHSRILWLHSLIVTAYYKDLFVFAICLSYSSTLCIMFLLVCPLLVSYKFLQTIISHFNTLHHSRLGLIFSCLCFSVVSVLVALSLLPYL